MCCVNFPPVKFNMYAVHQMGRVNTCKSYTIDVICVACVTSVSVRRASNKKYSYTEIKANMSTVLSERNLPNNGKYMFFGL